MENIEIIRFKKLLNSETKRRWGSLKRYWGHQDPTTREQRECQNNERCNKKNDNFARASHFFVHFFAVFARLRRENFARFMENVNKQRRNLISLLKLGYVPEEFNSSCVRLHLTKQVGRKNRDKD